MHHKTKAKIERLIAKAGFKTFDWNDGVIRVSGEEGDGAADYYGEFSGTGYPTIHPRLEEIAEDNDCFWEWMNPGAIALYEV